MNNMLRSKIGHNQQPPQKQQKPNEDTPTSDNTNFEQNALRNPQNVPINENIDSLSNAAAPPPPPPIQARTKTQTPSNVMSQQLFNEVFHSSMPEDLPEGVNLDTPEYRTALYEAVIHIQPWFQESPNATWTFQECMDLVWKLHRGTGYSPKELQWVLEHGGREETYEKLKAGQLKLHWKR